MDMNPRQLATVLAALRYWQKQLLADQAKHGAATTMEIAQSWMPEHFDGSDDGEPLDMDEIEALCSQLNEAPPLEFAKVAWRIGDVTGMTDLTDDEAEMWLENNDSSIAESLISYGNSTVLPSLLETDGIAVKTGDDEDDDQAEDVDGSRASVGKVACRYCGQLECNFDCDESQAGGFENDEN